MADLMSMGGWYILPNLVTGWVQSAYYAIWIRAGEPKPQPGTRQFAIHRRRIQIFVVLAYLLYTIYEADHQLRQASDFYHILGVPHDVGEKGLLSRFRRLTVQFHPDKVASGGDRLQAEAFYVHLKQSRDVLADPAKRFAYDRLGPEVQLWRDCKTIHDFVIVGARNTTMYYFGTTLVLALLGLVGYLRYASFWRYFAIAAMYTFEMYSITRPDSPYLIGNVLNPALAMFTAHPPFLQFQTISLLRKIMVSFFIALSQVGPLIFPPTSAPNTDPTPEQLDRLNMLLQTCDQESSRLMALEMTPFAGDPAAMQDLKSSMRQWLIDNTVRSNPQVRDAMGRVVQPRSG